MQAIISSPDVPPRRNTTDRQKILFEAVLNATNCTTLDCLRSVPEAVMLKANDRFINSEPSGGGGGVFGPSLGFSPVLDSGILDMPEILFAQGRYHKSLQAVIVGTMANEVSTILNQEVHKGSFSRAWD
jgi:carboxylesterase type B